MRCYYILLLFSLMNILCDFYVSSCDENCADNPVFTPSRLVVKHGDPASATCTVCKTDCQGTQFGLERSVGEITENGTTISWTVDRMTEWETSPMCYYNDDNTSTQCCSILPVTIYKPPDSVSISFDNHSGPMLEGRQYTLLCAVHNVAPVANLSVTFYRGQTPLGSPQSKNNTEKKPVNETYTLTINASKEDNGVQYWCEAKLELGPEGPQPPPVMKSQHINAIVYYKPQVSPSSNPIIVTEGDTVSLNCSAVGNPSPSYNWTLPLVNSSPFHNSILIIKSVNFEDEGNYTCSAKNTVETVTVSFKIEVRANILPYIIGAVAIAVVLILAFLIVGYFQYYRHYRMGQYNTKDVFRLKKHLVPSSSV